MKLQESFSSLATKNTIEVASSVVNVGLTILIPTKKGKLQFILEVNGKLLKIGLSQSLFWKRVKNGLKLQKNFKTKEPNT